MNLQQANGATPYVLVKLREGLFALPSAQVVEMVLLSGVSAVPQVPPHVRGVINLRGKVLPLVDLRRRLGMPSALEDLEALIKLFEAREEDHRKWIQELDSAIKERRAFTLTTDPHRCAFGRWYDSLTTDNVVLAAQLRKIDEPHQRIHRRGAEALELAARQDYEAASAIAHDIRERELAVTLALFAETRTALREAHREVAVVAHGADRPFAVAVDAIESVEHLKEADDRMEVVLPMRPDGPVTSVRKRSRDEQLVLTLDASRIMMP